MSHSRDEIELFKRLKKDDLAAFNQIYQNYSKKVLSFSYSFSISLHDAEEIVQDTFLKLWQNRSKLDLTRSFDSLIFVMAKNLVLNKIKHYSLDQEHLKKYFIGVRKEYNLATEEKLDFDEVQSVINQIIEGLPEKRREIFILNRIKGLTYKQIAEHLNISQGTVEKQMKKALDSIHEKYGKYFKVLTVIFFL
ncbi:MAG: RNA polymerase sigma-70 factor [Cytophagales bacterium]|nr:RNA polymerase sigma-70 factor [Cytophagales bacterium]